MKEETKLIKRALNDLQRVINELDAKQIIRLCDLIQNCLETGGKLLIAGNGGSASDAHHMAAELVGRFTRERDALSAVCICSDTSILTALANDYGPESMFSRQVEALGREQDILLAITTSGSSPNIMSAVRAAKKKSMKVAGLTGSGGRDFSKMCDAAVVVASSETPRIQEAHAVVIHMVCQIIEERMFA